MAKQKRKIDDFGEFIPGCFKHHGAMSYEEFMKMNEAEQRLRAKREVVWAPIDGVELVNAGEDNFVAYMKYRIRHMTYASPKLTGDFKMIAAEYVKALTELRDAVMAVKTEEEMYRFISTIRNHNWDACISSYKVYSMRWNFNALKDRCIELNYPYNTRSKAEKTKVSFKLAPLEHVERDGPNYRKGVDATERKWKNAFKFRGVVFGASVPQKERKDDLNCGFDGFMDIATALDIENSDLSLGGKLNISFAARGRGGYPGGHYECIGEVINLTRLSGAGTFAKLWFHAFDDMLARHCGITSGHLASEADEDEQKRLPSAFNRLIRALKTDVNGRETAFYVGSQTFDKHFKKNRYGAWGANAEMVSRAFACYLRDAMNCKSDYVVAHSDSYHWESENEKVYAIPQGEERKLFNELFDMVFYQAKQIGLLHDRTDSSMKAVRSASRAEKSQTAPMKPAKPAKAAEPVKPVKQTKGTKPETSAKRAKPKHEHGKSTMHLFRIEDDGQMSFF